MLNKVEHNLLHVKSDFWQQLSIGLVVFDTNNKFIALNQSAKELLHIDEGIDAIDTSVDNSEPKQFGEYTDSLLELLALSEHKYSKQITGITGKSLTGILTVSEQYKIIELEESQESKFGEISHELRRPLSNIKSVVDTLYLWGAGNDEQARPKFLKQLHEQTNRLTTTLNELLSLSRIQAGSIPLNYQQINLYVVVAEIINMLQKQAGESDIKLINNIPENYLLIADLDKMEHVLQNLIENAIRYNKPSGHVTVNTGLKPNSFTVQDTGSGIKEEDQPKIFDRFKRINKTVPGTGLGLAIVKSIVDLHGGKINIKSEINKGTEFIIELPMQNIVESPFAL